MINRRHRKCWSASLELKRRAILDEKARHAARVCESYCNHLSRKEEKFIFSVALRPGLLSWKQLLWICKICDRLGMDDRFSEEDREYIDSNLS